MNGYRPEYVHNAQSKAVYCEFLSFIEKDNIIIDLFNAFVKKDEKKEKYINPYSDIRGFFSPTDHAQLQKPYPHMSKFFSNYSWMNMTQIFRLYVVTIIADVLLRVCYNGKKYICCDIERQLSDNRKLNINYDNNTTVFSSSISASLYIVYKLIRIIEIYDKYKAEKKLIEFTPSHFSNINEHAKSVEFAVLKVLNAKIDYTTLKLHQAINYLQNENLWYEKAYCDNLYRDKNGKSILDKEKFIGFNNLKTVIESIKSTPRKKRSKIQLQEITKFLPPPFLTGDIVIQHNSEYYGLSSLSSGETQRLFTISSILYHLRNLDFKQKGKKKIQYKNISLIFDETEQYFHPEYQRTFVDYLLKQLNNASFEHIENINILLVTHSPFMLSDISNSRILYLENGKKKDIERLTFASNINDLLRHSFFLENGFMGEFAKEKTLDLINYLSEKEYKYNWDKDKVSQFITQIGEPVIRTQLMKLFEKMQHETEDYEEWVTKEYMRIMEGKK